MQREEDVVLGRLRKELKGAGDERCEDRTRVTERKRFYKIRLGRLVYAPGCGYPSAELSSVYGRVGMSVSVLRNPERGDAEWGVSSGGRVQDAAPDRKSAVKKRARDAPEPDCADIRRHVEMSLRSKDR